MRDILFKCLLVGFGGFTGSVTRYLLFVLMYRHSVHIPMGTLLANILGCFLVGALAAMEIRTGPLSQETKMLLAVGFCGGLTTMSTMMHESSGLLWSHGFIRASLYVTLSVAVSLGALAGGMAFVRSIAGGMNG